MVPDFLVMVQSTFYPNPTAGLIHIPSSWGFLGTLEVGEKNEVVHASRLGQLCVNKRSNVPGKLWKVYVCLDMVCLYAPI